MGPGRQCADEQEDQNDEDDGSHTEESAQPSATDARIMSMPSAPDLGWSHLAQFIRQHTHEVRNELNGLELEAALLRDLLPDGETAASVLRMRAQIRRIATDLRALSLKFADPQPTRALYAARELFLIWQDQLAELHPAPTVRWSVDLGAEEVNVDAAALAHVFRELLANAQAFGTGASLYATAQVEDSQIIFELREPQNAPLETANWGRTPFASTRPGHHGFGLWEAQRIITANGGEVHRRFAPHARKLITALHFPVA